MTGVVLAGGESMRMGVEKSTLLFHGETLIARCVRRMRAQFGEVIIVGRAETMSAAPAGVEFVLDDSPGKGPVMAILTALEHTGDDCAVVACDMPYFQPSLLLEEWRLMERNQAAVPHYGELWEPLHAVYSARAVDPIRKWLEVASASSGRRPRIIHMLDVLTVVHVGLATIERYGSAGTVFFNVNSSTDYAEALLKSCSMEETSGAC